MRWRKLTVVVFLCCTAMPARAEHFRNRGVYYFDGPVRSPLAGIGSRGDYATNRVALDDDHTEVTVDTEKGRIVFSNSHRYSSTTVIGDLVFCGSGRDPRGGEVPFGVHLKVEKRGATFRAHVHPHPTSRARLADPRLAAYTVVARDGVTESSLLTPEQARRAIETPELTARLANVFIQATDHLDGRPIRPEVAEARLVDVSIGFGLQKANLKVARIELISQDVGNAPLIRHTSIGEMLKRGAWEFRITSKTWLPQTEFSRDLFLFGLDTVGFLQRLTKKGLARGETLAIGFRNGRGFVQLGTDRAEIANPADVARAYMEFHFIGGILARQVATLTQRLTPLAQASPP